MPLNGKQSDHRYVASACVWVALWSPQTNSEIVSEKVSERVSLPRRARAHAERQMALFLSYELSAGSVTKLRVCCTQAWVEASQTLSGGSSRSTHRPVLKRGGSLYAENTNNVADFLGRVSA